MEIILIPVFNLNLENQKECH